MKKADGFLAKHEFETPEAIPLRLSFWYYEYLKRHLLQHSLDMCWDIATANLNLRTELSGKVNDSEKIDTTKFAIREYILRKYNYPESLSVDTSLGPLVDKVTESTEELRFLSDITEQYGYYAHWLIVRNDMTVILKHINGRKDIADIGMEEFACCIPSPDNGIELRSDMSAAHEGIWKLDFSINIFRDDFDFAAVVDEMAYQIAARRHFLAAQKSIVDISNKERSIISRKNLPPGLELNKHSSDKSRTIGLWCWDAIVFLSPDPMAIYKNLSLRHSAPPLAIPFSEKKSVGIAHAELLSDLLQSGLVDIFPETEKTAPCRDPKRNCLHQSGKKRKGEGLEKECGYYPSCIRRLGKLLNNANLCVEKKQIIPIGNN